MNFQKYIFFLLRRNNVVNSLFFLLNLNQVYNLSEAVTQQINCNFYSSHAIFDIYYVKDFF